MKRMKVQSDFQPLEFGTWYTGRGFEVNIVRYRTLWLKYRGCRGGCLTEKNCEVGSR